MDLLQGLNVGDLTGTGLLLVIAVKMTQLDNIIKRILKDCPLFNSDKKIKKGLCTDE